MQPTEAESVTQWPEDGAVADVWVIDLAELVVRFERYRWNARFREDPARCEGCGERRWVGAWTWCVCLGGDEVKELHSTVPTYVEEMLRRSWAFASEAEAIAGLRERLEAARTKALARLDKLERQRAALGERSECATPDAR